MTCLIYFALIFWPLQLLGPPEPWQWWAGYLVLVVGVGELSACILRHRDRFGLLYGWRGYGEWCRGQRRIEGWCFGGSWTANEGSFVVEWPPGLFQIVWRIPRTAYTRGMHGGICFDELWPRAWFSIEGDRTEDDRGRKGRYALASLHLYFPSHRHPFGKVSGSYWPQNDSWGVPC